LSTLAAAESVVPLTRAVLKRANSEAEQHMR
jgi:hypothetical protein